MTNPIVNFDSNQSLSNPLKSETNVQAMIDASLLISGIPTFNNATSYVTDDIVYYLGVYYIAPSNIASGGGTPLANTTWHQIPNWGGYATTATAAGTTTLTKYSPRIQRFSGVTTQTVVMGVASTFPALGDKFYFVNDSTGSVTIQSSGANTIIVLLAGQRCVITLILLSGTSAASWTYDIGQETATTLGALISGATGKTTPVDADTLGLSDSAASGVMKSLTWANLKATLITTWKDVTGGFVGMTLYKINFKNAANTFTSFFTNANTAARTYTFQDRNGTISDDTDLALKAPLASPTFTGTVTIPTPFVLGAVSVLPTGTELNYVDGVTSAIQTQLDAKAPLASPTFTGTVAMNGDLQLAENISILLDAALSADGKWSGICESGVIGDTTVLFGELLYFKAADSRWWRCDSDAEATSGPVKLGICVVAGTAGDTRTIMLKGKINAASLYPTLTIGARCYIGSTAGNIQVAIPTSGFVRVIGSGNTADELWFDPSWTYYELGSAVIAMTSGTGSITINASYNTIAYKKINGNINLTGYLAVGSVSTPTGTWRLTGLPFTNGSGERNKTAFAVSQGGPYEASFTAGSIVIRLESSVTQVEIYKITAGVLDDMGVDVKAGSQLYICGNYQV